MKLWDKGTALHLDIEAFTVGADRELDVHLAPFDILGTLAHTQMLMEVGLLEQADYQALRPALISLYNLTQTGAFVLSTGVEDIHSEVEMRLTQQLGDIGKKVHSGRSRNDQVLLDLKLFVIHQIDLLAQGLGGLFQAFISKSRQHQDILLPGYTHLQVAMPSSFGLWFGAYAEALIDDLLMLKGAFEVADQNPLGSAAGYGSSFPLDRKRTTDLLGFSTLAYNVVYAQMGRGKLERIMGYAIASVASTLNKLASDACLFMSQNFGFISLPDHMTTGSSIMPHKKNPDVFEILRARTNRLQGIPNQISLTTTNLPSGYHRDLQLTKEMLLPALAELQLCIQIAQEGVTAIEVQTDILQDNRYQYLFSVEEVNKLVLQGIPFREAYQQVGREIAAGHFHPEQTISHTHIGSIGYPAQDEIEAKWQSVKQNIPVDRFLKAWEKLLT